MEVQVQISSGLPAFLVVGLPDKASAKRLIDAHLHKSRETAIWSDRA